MTYWDMRWRNHPHDEDPQAVAREMERAAATTRGRDHFQARPCRFGLHQRAMSHLRFAMEGTGMTFRDYPLPPEGDTSLKTREWHAMERPGIPLHKFSSNIGWIISPAECSGALWAWKHNVDQLGEQHVLDVIRTKKLGGGTWWPAWIAFLEGAVTHDGFEVW